MSEHKRNPVAIAASAAKAPIIPGPQMVVQFQLTRQLKPTVLICKHDHHRVVDGKDEWLLRKTAIDSEEWMATPGGYVCKVEGQPIEMEDTDFVVTMMSVCQHGGGIVGAHGQVPVTGIPIAEMARMDAAEVMKAHSMALERGHSGERANGSG